MKTFTVDICSLGFCYEIFVFVGYDYEMWLKKPKSACIMHSGFLSLDLIICLFKYSTSGFGSGNHDLIYACTQHKESMGCIVGGCRIHPLLLCALVKTIKVESSNKVDSHPLFALHPPPPKEI